MEENYIHEAGDQFYRTGIYGYKINPDGSKTVEMFNPYGGPSYRIFSPQAAERGQASGDYPPGYVTPPAGSAIARITGLVHSTSDPYLQGDVFSSTSGNVTVPNIGWPK